MRVSASPELSDVAKHWTAEAAFHRAMALAHADEPAKCDAHKAKMNAALDELRKLALAGEALEIEAAQ